MRRGRAMLAAMSALAIAGCTEQSIFAGAPATTPAQCEAQYREALSRGGNSYTPAPTSGAGVAGAAVGKGMARGIIEGAYNQCLARVGATRPAPGMTRTAPAENARARAMSDLDQAQYGDLPSSQCGPRSPVFIGGTTYCIGTHQ